MKNQENTEEVVVDERKEDGDDVNSDPVMKTHVVEDGNCNQSPVTLSLEHIFKWSSKMKGGRRLNLRESLWSLLLFLLARLLRGLKMWWWMK